jgi:SNF2 family DNA or RNA helicase
MIGLDIRSGDLVLRLDEATTAERRILSPYLASLAAHKTGDELIIRAKEDLWNVVRGLLTRCARNGIRVEASPSIQQLIKQLNTARESLKAAQIEHSQDSVLDRLTHFKRQLTPLQRDGAANMVRARNCANFSVPGAGKTTVALAAYEVAREAGIVDKLLVICPRAAFQPWEDEFDQCMSRDRHSARLTGSRDQRLDTYLHLDAIEVLLCTYQMAANDLDDLIALCRANKVFLVLDESHYVKRFDEGVWAGAVLGLATHAERRAILSGTPMPQSPFDLWSQFTFLWPGRNLLGNRYQFRRELESEGVGPMLGRIRPFFVRTTKAQLNLTLPDIKPDIVQLSPIQKQVYEAIAGQIRTEWPAHVHDQIDDWQRARTVRLMQAASNPALLSEFCYEFKIPPLSATGAPFEQLVQHYSDYEMPAKLVRAIELAQRETRKGNKLIIWSSFVKNIEMLYAMLKDVAPTYLVYGAIPRDFSEDIDRNREQQLRDFRNTNGPAILLANPAACGESISLHKECHLAIYLDRTFDCARYLQSKDRIHRFGMPEGVVARYLILVAEGTIDEVIEQRLGVKEDRMRAVFESADPVVGDLEIGEESELEQDDLEAVRRHLDQVLPTT